jgi:hypothetical protein
MRGLFMEKAEGDYWVHDIDSKRQIKGKFNTIFSKREEGMEQVFRVICLHQTKVRCATSHTPTHTI